MASLELVPHPDVLVVQAGVFLANLFVVKKLLIEPYLSVRDKRDALTVGSKEDAQRALAEAESISQKIEGRIAAAATEAKSERERIRGVAIEKRQKLLDAASADARKLIESVERQIQQELTAERSKIPSVVAALTDEVYKLALA